MSPKLRALLAQRKRKAAAHGVDSNTTVFSNVFTSRDIKPTLADYAPLMNTGNVHIEPHEPNRLWLHSRKFVITPH